MKLDVQVSGKTVAQLYRERDEYVLKYLPGADAADFISLTMPVRDEPWRWPRDLHPFFRQNLPEGYLNLEAHANGYRTYSNGFNAGDQHVVIVLVPQLSLIHI